MLPPYYVGIDWDWVKKETLRAEKIDTDKKNSRTDSVKTALDGSIRKARSLARPKYIYMEKRILQMGADFIEIEGPIRLSTSRIPQYITGATHMVFSLVTIGDGIEKEAGLLTSGKDPLNGYLLDRIGSFAVESLAENMEKRLRKIYSMEKKSVSSRFSPGYCDWPIEEQSKMASIIDFSKAGVSLNEACMMVPKKSISAIVAVADEGIFKEFISSCDICENKDCGYRRSV